MVAPFLPDEVKHPFRAPVPIALDIFDRPEKPATPAGFVTHASAPSSELAAELDGAAQWLGVQPEEILLAALGRAFGRTRGEGAVTVAVRGPGRVPSHPVTLLCAAAWPMGPSEMLQGAHNALSDARHPGSPADITVQLDGVTDAPGATALQVHVRRIDGDLYVDWCYDPTRLDGYSVEEMAEQFGLALIEITSDAGAPL
ncbi:MAG: hypothetical protein AB1925_20080 [Actinomycetota bacterium]